MSMIEVIAACYGSSTLDTIEVFEMVNTEFCLNTGQLLQYAVMDDILLLSFETAILRQNIIETIHIVFDALKKHDFRQILIKGEQNVFDVDRCDRFEDITDQVTQQISAFSYLTQLEE